VSVSRAIKSEIYAYFDGDDVGAAVELRLIDDDPEGAASASRRVCEAIDSLAEQLQKEFEAVVYYAAGDEVLARLPRSVSKSDLDQLRSDFQALSGLSLSCGVGETPSEAAFRLRVAKLRGKDQTQGPTDG